MKRKINECRIMLREEPQWPERELKTQQPQLPRNRKISGKLKMWDWQAESLKNVSGDFGCLQRLSERSCKFRSGVGWGRWGWWRYRAGQAERRWRTRLGDEHSLENGTAVHGGMSVETDEAWQIDTPGVWGYSRRLPRKRPEIWHCRREGSCCC